MKDVMRCTVQSTDLLYNITLPHPKHDSRLLKNVLLKYHKYTVLYAVNGIDKERKAAFLCAMFNAELMLNNVALKVNW